MKKTLLLNLIMILGMAVSAQATLFLPGTDNHLKFDEYLLFSYVDKENIDSNSNQCLGGKDILCSPFCC